MCLSIINFMDMAYLSVTPVTIILIIPISLLKMLALNNLKCTCILMQQCYCVMYACLKHTHAVLAILCELVPCIICNVFATLTN